MKVRPHSKNRPIRLVDDANVGTAKHFEYMFYVDFEASMADVRAQNALAEVQEFTSFLRVLGSFYAISEIKSALCIPFSLFDFISCLPFGSLKMADVERVDMGSQAETSSSSKRDMGCYSSTMKPSDVKALTHKYKIPRDLHSSEWTMDRLDDDCIGLYEQYFEFAGLKCHWVWPGCTAGALTSSLR
ncbi:hypothetical protein Tco_1554782 [Tanacetum coccineum]